MHVDAVQYWAAEPFLIPGNRGFSARAGAGRVAVVAARTRIARGDQHELGRKAERLAGASDRDHTVFDGLAHHLEDARMKLGHLVEEEDATMGQADFAGPRR